MLRAGLLLSVVVHALSAFGQSPTVANPTTFKVGSTNVLVDIVVTDHHGVPVEGLTRDDFSILQDGHPQRIVSFEAHSGEAVAAAPPSAKLPAGVYTNAPVVPAGDSADVLLIDSLNTPVGSQARSHQLLLDYLKTLPPNKAVAVFTLTADLRQIEDFTTDHSTLLKAVEQLKNPQKSPFLATNEDRARQMKDEDEKLEESLGMQKGLAYLATEQMKALQQFNSETNAFNTGLRVQLTLAAFDQLAGYLSGIPGRKNVIWVSGSFPLSILPDIDLKNPFQAARNFTPEVSYTANLLANARVAIYPVDARGLYPQALKGAETSAGSAVRNPDRIAHAESQEFSRGAEEQMSLEKVAHDTGGKAIYNTNDLKGAFAEVDRDGSHYYTLAYVPADRSSVNKPHSIEVRVSPGEYHLSYRRSYIPARPEDSSGDRHFILRMKHDAPASSEIIFRLSPIRVAPEPASTAIAGSNPKAPRPVIRYSIDYQVDASSFALLPSTDSTLHGVATLMSIVYDRSGKPLNSTSNLLQIHVPIAQYSEFLKQGIHYREVLDIPAQAVSLRAGVFDQESGRSGSLEVPFLASPGHPAP